MEWNFEASGPVEADIAVPAGMIDVVRSTGNTITVDLQALGTGRRSDEVLAATEVSFAGEALRVKVPDRFGRNAEVRCTVSLPEGSALATRTASADVDCPVPLDRYSGSTASGDVALGNVEHDVSVKSASGDLQCAEIGGRLQALTASGDVSVRKAGGEARVTTASGDVEILDACASLKVGTASGDVHVGRAFAGKVQVESASGDLAIGVAAGVGAYLDVTTVSGDTNTTLPFTEEGAGGAVLEIVCRTVSGDVSIRKAAS
jgi:hypothetical protein